MTFTRLFRLRPGYLRVIKFLIILFGIWNVFYITSLLYKTSLEDDLNKMQKDILNLINVKDNKVMKYFESSNKIILPESGIELEDGLTEDAQRFIKELNLTNPGEYGKPVILNETLLTDEHKKLINQGKREYGSNVFVSNLISLNRVVSDNRSEYCKNQVYKKDLPKVSIVVAFYNEPWSVLIRLLHSVLINTPEHLLEEIVLADDYSDKEELKQPLEEYCKKLKKVKLFRSHARLGVVGARVLGFRNAKGPVMVSLDSHVEVAPGWLEPMLDRLADDKNLVTMSVIKYMDKEDFGPHYDNSWGALGGFDFGMNFNWLPVDTYEKNLSVYAPHKSPTLFGPCWAIWDSYLRHIDYLDVEFDIWGGDDVDLSFKIWLCGGSIEMVPCAVAIHLWRDHKYHHESKGKGGYRWNTDRIAETWLDDNYKKYYYRLVGDSKDRNYGDISARLEHKKKIGCKNFSWLVENVHPRVEIPKEITDEVWLKKNKVEDKKDDKKVENLVKDDKKIENQQNDEKN